MKQTHFSVMATSRILGIFIFLLIYFSICFYNDQAVILFMTSVDVQDINIESTVVPADINVLEAEKQMPSNNQKHLQGKGMRHEKRKKRNDLYEENLSDKKKGNSPVPGSLGKYFVYVNCTECKVKSELLVKSKSAKKSGEKSKSTKKSREKSKSRITENERRLAQVEHDEDEEQEEPNQEEEWYMDKEEMSTTEHDPYYLPMYYITHVNFKDVEVYQFTDEESTDKELSKETSIETTMKEITTLEVTTEEKTTELKSTAEESSSGFFQWWSTREETSTELKITEGKTTSGETTEKATTEIETTGGKTTIGEATTKKGNYWR